MDRTLSQDVSFKYQNIVIQPYTYFANPKYVNFVHRHQRNKLKLDDVPKLPEWQRLRLQHCSNDMSVPNLVIRDQKLIKLFLLYYVMMVAKGVTRF